MLFCGVKDALEKIENYGFPSHKNALIFRFGEVAQTCNPDYSGGRDQEDHGQGQPGPKIQ
jgi:hypothetical protein